MLLLAKTQTHFSSVAHTLASKHAQCGASSAGQRGDRKWAGPLFEKYGALVAVSLVLPLLVLTAN